MMLPISNDIGPCVLTVEQRSTEPHCPNHQVASGENVFIDAIYTNSSQINFDRRSFLESLRIMA